ncbi:hypothetical protein [Nocardia sp. XZ_19_385]|uniref:hypothetical protein n=1 Tax=Nocardia sp. XZ_19_385 TaxID=2769488 RepID=UPI0018909C55|nr:hypothetical protein [Nocardia sp. XZ_19_385]
MEFRPDIAVVSPDRRWWFIDGELRSDTATYQPHQMYCFERWTYARFPRDGVFVLGFETDYQWDDAAQDVTGPQHGGLLVLTLDHANCWQLVEFDHDERYGEQFAPSAVVWHPRGVLAWLDNGELAGRALRRPRILDSRNLQGLNYCDDFELVRLEFEVPGAWETLEISADGAILTVGGQAGVDRFDLDNNRVSRAGAPWQEAVSSSEDPLY